MSEAQGSVEAFQAAVGTAFGVGWSVERTPTGFQVSSDADAGIVLDVTVDEAARTFTRTLRRGGGFDTVESGSGWGPTGFRAEQTRRSGRSWGTRTSTSFRRGPDGQWVAAAPAGPEGVVVRVGGELGWTDATPGSGLARFLTPKTVFILVGAIFGVAILMIVGIGAIVLTASGILRG